MPDNEQSKMQQPISRELRHTLVDIVGAESVHIDEPMCVHTTFQVGGPADVLVTPATQDEVVAVREACRAAGVAYFLLGRGSDVLVGDKGYRGVMIDCAGALDDIMLLGDPREPCQLVCEAGAAIIDAAQLSASLGLTGLEFACGIPGSVGGAVFMNAGAYGGCCSDVVESARCLMPDGSIADIGVDELALGYRTSRVRTDGLVVLSATFALMPGDPAEISARIADLTEQRERKQPLELPSAGSTFKRPAGYFAGKLITDAGLKGYRFGGAAVSSKHAGFVVNLDHATAADVRAVITHVRETVAQRFGVMLELEVRFVGEF